jgi:hypothetical protein
VSSSEPAPHLCLSPRTSAMGRQATLAIGAATIRASCGDAGHEPTTSPPLADRPRPAFRSKVSEADRGRRLVPRSFPEAAEQCGEEEGGCRIGVPIKVVL